jgi:DNA mismatch repair ATPase MutL
LRTFLTAFDHRRSSSSQQALFGATSGSPARQPVYDLTRRFEGARRAEPVSARTERETRDEYAGDTVLDGAGDGIDAAEPRQTLHQRPETPYPISSNQQASSAEMPDRRENSEFRYLGQIMDLFLAVEIDDTLYLVDQHAAHERIIYDRLRGGSGGQELLFPIQVEVPREKETLLREHDQMLRRLGIVVEKEGSRYELASVPAMLSLSAEDLAALLMDLLEEPDDFERELFASLSCRAAVMDGDPLSADVAIEIITGVIGLENARCPHGRPVWVAFSKAELAELVGRT